MCGIFGSENPQFEASYFFDLMAHRGPDSAGLLRESGWTLGHLRLAIVDLDSEANQPFEKDGAYVVFNGEIYNHQELKKEFFPGQNFRTNSDTELLLAMLNLLGESALNFLNGMFAFAWLSSSGNLLLARDRFGVKPLYFAEIDEHFHFSSEIKPLLRLQGHSSFDRESVDEFLRIKASDFSWRSGYEGIHSLQAGHLLHIFADGQQEDRQWYHGSDSNYRNSRAESQQLDMAENLLTDSIRLRCQADAPICVALSGGIDSTSIYVLMKERLGLNVQPFVYKKSWNNFDEAEVAIALARRYGDEPIVVEEKAESVISALQDSLHHLEFPIWDISSIAYSTFYAAISEHGFKVVIEGHGADELLGGYPYMVEAAFLELIRSGKLKEAFQIFLMMPETIVDRFPDLSILEKFFTYSKSLYRYIARTKPPGLQQTLDYAFTHQILPIVLRAFDRLSMSKSIESRMPFMDYRFVEFAKSLPLSSKVSAEGSKTLLRRILRKYGAHDLADRNLKTGFGANISELMKSRELLETLEGWAAFAPEAANSSKVEELDRNRYRSWRNYSASNDVLFTPAMFGYFNQEFLASKK